MFSVVSFNQRPKGTSQQKLKKFSVLSVFSVVPFNQRPKGTAQQKLKKSLCSLCSLWFLLTNVPKGHLNKNSKNLSALCALCVLCGSFQPTSQRDSSTKTQKISVLSVFSVVPFNHHPDQQHPPGRQQPNIVRVPKGRTKTIILSVPSVLSVVPFPYHHPHGLHQSQTQMKKTLSHLQKMTARFDPRLITIFPKETEEEKHRFDLLVRGYVGCSV